MNERTNAPTYARTNHQTKQKCNFSLGSRISLISKKNIRYEGVLYSINEANATVALQNVKSFGTEGREKLDPENTAFVAPQDGIHAYLLFRGCDIKDLHVHEQKTELTTVDPAAAGAATATTAPPQPEPVPAPAEGHQPSTSAVTKSEPAAAATAKAVPEKPEAGGKTNTATSSSKNKNNNNNNVPKEEGRGGRGGGGGGKTNMVGSGASLLNRKARGTVEGGKFLTFTQGFTDSIPRNRFVMH
jgi:protein LSM14